MSSTKAINLIVPVYKNAALTKRCIDSILENIQEIKQFSPRLLIINDSPDDKEVNALLKELAVSKFDVIIFTNSVNCGFVKSVNRGLEASIRDGRDVILVNSDTETFKGTLANLVDAAYSDSQIGFVSPRSNNASFCSLPHSQFSATQLSPLETHERWKEIGATLPKVHFTPTAVGFYMFIKHKVLATIGGLRVEFGVGYEEENDLVMRGNRLGYRAALANRSFAFHAGSASFNLLDLDLHDHRNSNLQKMCANYPEFLPLVRRYEASPHFRAELLLSGLIGHTSMPIKVIIDLSGLGCNHNGTNELALGIVKSLGKRQDQTIELSVLCTTEAFEFHKLSDFENILRVDANNHGKHAIALRLGQPFDQHHINVLESLAPINVWGMLDTIAEDCGNLSITHNLSDHWQHVAQHSNGLFFISKFSEETFYARYPDAQELPKYTRLLPTRLTSYESSQRKFTAQHVLILGNHFSHKASDSTSVALSLMFPTVQFVVLGATSFEKNNVRGFRSGTLDPEAVRMLFSRASVVVLPSHVEGFGFGLMHALAARKPIVARNIDATNEILATYKKVDGVYLYDNDTEIKQALLSAIKQDSSTVDDSTAIGWDQWTDGLVEFFKLLLKEKDVFPRLSKRIYSADLLRRALHLEQRLDIAVNAVPAVSQPPEVIEVPAVKQPPEEIAVPTDTQLPALNVDQTQSLIPTHTLASLMLEEDKQFVEHTYITLFKRPADLNGLDTYLTHLRRGVPRIKILDDLYNSEERNTAGGELKGLQEAITKYRRSKSPIFGSLFKR